VQLQFQNTNFKHTEIVSFSKFELRQFLSTTKTSNYKHTCCTCSPAPHSDCTLGEGTVKCDVTVWHHIPSVWHVNEWTFWSCKEL